MTDINKRSEKNGGIGDMDKKSTNRVYKRVPLVIMVFAIYLFGVSFAVAGTQVVSLNPAVNDIVSGQTVELALNYNVLDGKSKTTGLGISIHFNSKAIKSLSLEDVYGEGMVGQDYTPKDDVSDLDNDPETDKYVIVAWMGLMGGWPRLLELPAQIGNVVVKTKVDGTLMNTKINVVGKETAAGYQFEGKSTKLTIH